MVENLGFRRVRRAGKTRAAVLAMAWLVATLPVAHGATDSDGDGLDDVDDNCLLLSNPDQRDSDNDGYGNVCDADLTGDLLVNFADLAAFKSSFLQTGDLAADFDGNGTVDFGDLARLKAVFGQPPGPSGVVSGGIAVEPVRRFPNLSFSSPIALLQAPDDDTRWFVVQQGGVVYTFANDNQTTTRTKFIDIDPRVESGGEAGLLGMAFHPLFDQNGHVFLSYTRKGPVGGPPLVSYLSRFTSTDGGATLNDATEMPLLTQDQPYANHNGGNIAFGPDGYLYMGFGDGGSGGDPRNEAQDPGSFLGAMLRIDVDVSAVDWDAGVRYYIPAGNPFAANASCAAPGGCPEIYAWGLRNPWRWSFDPVAPNTLWLGDVGQFYWEEINIIESGGNYGWRCYEGEQQYNTSGCDAPDSYRFPVLDYGHGEGNSVTGGYVYRGSLIPQLYGVYLFGDYTRGLVWGITPEGERLPDTLIDVNWGLPSFGQGHDGEVYMLNYVSGTIFRIEPQ